MPWANVNRASCHYTLLFIMVTALLSMPWATAHIHLAQHHDHDSTHHQHSVKAHSHQFTEHQVSNHHADLIDSASHSSEKSVVSLAHECHSSKEYKHSSADSAAPHSGFANTLQTQPRHLEFSLYITSYPLPPPRTTDQPRAPPALT